MVPTGELTVLHLSGQRIHSDIRKYMLACGAQAGARVVHVYCWENVIITFQGETRATHGTMASPATLLRDVVACLGRVPDVVLTGLGGGGH